MQMSQSKIRTSQNSPTFLDHTRNCLIKKKFRSGGVFKRNFLPGNGGGGERGNSYESIFKISNARIDRRNVFVIYQSRKKTHHRKVVSNKFITFPINKIHQKSLVIWLRLASLLDERFVNYSDASNRWQSHYYLISFFYFFSSVCCSFFFVCLFVLLCFVLFFFV